MVRAKGKFDKKPKIKRKKLIFKNTLRKIKNKNRIKDNIKIINPQFLIKYKCLPINPKRNLHKEKRRKLKLKQI